MDACQSLLQLLRQLFGAFHSSALLLLGLGDGITMQCLAGIGVFGVAAYTVARRTSELGLRIALGASRRAVIYEALHDTMVVVAIGLVAGLAGAFAGARMVSSFVSDMLFGLEASDWHNLTLPVALMIVVALFACLAPVLRALRIDPVKAMRHY